MADDTPHISQTDTVTSVGREIAGLLDGDGREDEREEKEQSQESTETQQEQTQEGQDTTDLDTKDEETTDETKAEAEQEQEAEELRTLEDVAKRLGLESSEGLNNLKLSFKAAGQDTEATLHDLVSSYQQQSHLTSRLAEVSNERKQVETARVEYQEKVGAKIQSLDDTILALNSVIDSSVPDLAALKESDPTEYLLKQEEVRGLTTKINQAFAKRQAWIEEQEQHQQLQAQGYLQAQFQKLPELIPEWKDEGKAKAEKGEIKSYLGTAGFADQEIGQLHDARHVALVRKAMLYDKLQQSKPVVINRVSKALKPGAAQPSHDANSGLKQRALKSGSVNDMGKYFAARINEANREK